MNIDFYRKVMKEESVPQETNTRVMRKLQEAGKIHREGVRPKGFALRHLKPARLATLVLCFVLLSFGTLTAAGKVLHDDWFALFKALETKSAATADNPNSPYQQLVGETKTQNGLAVTLEKIYFDGKILFTDFVVRSEDGGDIFKDAELAAKYQTSMNVSAYTHLDFGGAGSCSYFSTGKRMDEGSDPKQMHFTTYTLISEWPQNSDRMTIALSGISLQAAGPFNPNEKPYFLFDDEDWVKAPETSPLRFNIQPAAIQERTTEKLKEGLTLAYSDLSLSLDYDADRADLPKWYLTERAPLIGAKDGYAGISSGIPITVTVQYLDGSKQSFETTARCTESLFLKKIEDVAAPADEQTRATGVTLAESVPEPTCDEGGQRNRQYLKVIIPFTDVLNADEIAAFEIGGEHYPVK